jgi:hypothetical protein
LFKRIHGIGRKVTLHLAREASWNLASGFLALAAMAALLARVEVV